MNKQARMAKTAKGEEEIKTRAGGLSRSERFALILVDGKTTVEEVLRKAPGMSEVEEALAALLEKGYVELDVASNGSAGGHSTLKQELIDIVEQVLGDDAERIVNKLKTAPEGVEALKEAVNQCKKTVTLIIDERKAQELARRCASVLERF